MEPFVNFALIFSISFFVLICILLYLCYTSNKPKSKTHSVTDQELPSSSNTCFRNVSYKTFTKSFPLIYGLFGLLLIFAIAYTIILQKIYLFLGVIAFGLIASIFWCWLLCFCSSNNSIHEASFHGQQVSILFSIA